MELLPLVILFFGGIFAGLYSSNVGGGSLVTFPLLILSGLPTPIAIATNRFAVVFLEFSSAAKFYSKGQVDMKLGLQLGAIAAAGSIIGSHILLAISETYLNLIIALLLVILFAVSYEKKHLGIVEKKVTAHNVHVTMFFTFLLGIYGGFFGGGFGTFIMFLLVLMGFTFIKSAAIGRVIGFLMSLAAAIVFVINGAVVYSFAIALGLGNALGAWIGAGIGMRKGDEFIKMLFFVIILVTVLKLLFDVF